MQRRLILLFLLISGTVFAVPSVMNYQGRLLDSASLPITSSTTQLVFKLYTVPSGGSAFWTETWNGGSSFVTIQNGLFNVELGTYVPLTPATFVTDTLYLGITVAGDIEMSPRQHLATAPYAMKAGSLGAPLDFNLTNVTFTGRVDFSGATITGLTFSVPNPLSMTSAAPSTAVFNNTLGSGIGVLGQAVAPTGYGVFGFNSNTLGNAWGVYGKTSSTASGSAGVHGENLNAGNIGAGVEGVNSQGNGIGVFGNNTNLGVGNSMGVYARTQGSQGTGLRAENVGAGNTGMGLYANNSSALGTGAWIQNTGGGEAMRVSGGAKFGQGSVSFTAHVDFAGATITGLTMPVPNPLSLPNNLAGPVIYGANIGTGPGVRGDSIGGAGLYAVGLTGVAVVITDPAGLGLGIGLVSGARGIEVTGSLGVGKSLVQVVQNQAANGGDAIYSFNSASASAAVAGASGDTTVPGPGVSTGVGVKGVGPVGVVGVGSVIGGIGVGGVASLPSTAGIYGVGQGGISTVGVKADNESGGYGLYASSLTGTAIYASGQVAISATSSSMPIYARNTLGGGFLPAILAEASGTGLGVLGRNTSTGGQGGLGGPILGGTFMMGVGVHGIGGSGAAGVLGEGDMGVYGKSTRSAGTGVKGETDQLSGFGVDAINTSGGIAVNAASTGGTAISAQGAAALDANGAIYGHNDIWVDNNNANNGSATNSLKFGNSGSEAIASKRTATGNQNGLDLYTNNSARLSITNGGRVGIGTTSPTSNLQVNGSFAINTRTVGAGSTTLLGTDSIVLVANGGSTADVFLPNPSGITGRLVTIKRLGVGVNYVYVHPSSSEQIDMLGSGTAYNLTVVYDAITVVSDGTNWWVVSKN